MSIESDLLREAEAHRRLALVFSGYPSREDQAGYHDRHADLLGRAALEIQRLRVEVEASRGNTRLLAWLISDGDDAKTRTL